MTKKPKNSQDKTNAKCKGKKFLFFLERINRDDIISTSLTNNAFNHDIAMEVSGGGGGGGGEED